ncbi:hypothetical protein BY996DRAFT_6408590 [Phakopsora pachyrhizi]|nr:hypothetical protein BY996DRAFT_6408590 [Phakopsora pachyrhizi]
MTAPESNFVLSINPLNDFDVALDPHLDQEPLDVRSPVGSLSEHSQLIRPPASISYATTPNLEPIYPQHSEDFQSWQSLVQHKGNHNEDLLAHQNEATRLKKTHNSDVEFVSQLSKAPPDLTSPFGSLSEHLKLTYPSASSSSAITPNIEAIYPRSSNDYTYLSQDQNLNGENLLNNFFDGENSSKRTKITNPGAYLSSYQDSKNQNQNWPFETLVDLDFTDAQFNSMIDAYFRAPMPHEENLNEKNFFGSLFDKNILRREAVESFNEKKMPSHSTGEIDYPQKSLFCSSINKDDSECSKSQETERLLKYKRKYYTYESKSVGARELNSEVAEIFGAEGGSIDQKFRLKSQLDGLVGTSNANLETVDEEIKMKLDEPEKTYKLLKSKNEKTLVEYETFNQASQIYSFQPRAAWENVRNKAEDNVSKTGYFIDANSEYPKTGLEFLMNVLFKQLKLQEHNELTSLDNFIEGIYRRAKSRLHPDYVLGSLIDWNLGKSIEERVNYFVECDEELKKQRKRTGKMKTLDRNYSNNINKAIFKEASKKIKSFWNSYYEKFRHNYLPLSKGTQNYDYKLLIREIGVLRDESLNQKFMAQILNFIEDCAIVDFLESATLPK